jgi:hypothetical protein
MTPMTPDQDRDKDAVPELGSVADQLQQESERLRQLAQDLKAREEALTAMQADYQNLKRAVYSLLREQFERELPPIPHDDLEAYAAEEGAVPLEAFIDQLERPEEVA